jgi:hypothetical protein
MSSFRVPSTSFNAAYVVQTPAQAAIAAAASVGVGVGAEAVNARHPLFRFATDIDGVGDDAGGRDTYDSATYDGVRVRNGDGADSATYDRVRVRNGDGADFLVDDTVTSGAGVARISATASSSRLTFNSGSSLDRSQHQQTSPSSLSLSSSLDLISPVSSPNTSRSYHRSRHYDGSRRKRRITKRHSRPH